MAQMSVHPLVLIIGATGRTGGSIVDGLLKSGQFRVAALVRPSSASKPEAAQLRERGVEIRLGDIQTDNIDKLKELLSAVYILISAVNIVHDQKGVLAAAKEVGVKRVVPCDFGTPGAPGVHDLRDTKFTIRNVVRSLGVSYTFIDVGWWMQLVLPYPSKSESPDSKSIPISRQIYGKGDKKNLYTDYRRIGDYVARIIADERTINQYVIVWEEELTLEQAKTIGEKASGEEEVLRAKRIPVSAEELVENARSGQEEALRTQSFAAFVKWSSSQYQYSMHILGENSLENAKALGALDARELYPDIVPTKLEDFAKEFYHDPPSPYF